MCFCKKKIIAPKFNINNKELLIVQKLHRKGIKLGTKLVVPRNFAFVVFKNGRVLDVLKHGEYALSAQTLPKSIKKLNLYSNLNKIKFVPVSACFVNLNDFDDALWQTKKIELEDKKYGVFKISASGKYDFKIIDEEKFLLFLFSEIVELSSESSAEMLLSAVNETLEKAIYEKNYNAEMLYFKDKQISKDLFTKLTDNLHCKGISLGNVVLNRVEFPNKTLKELEKLKAPEESNIAETSAFENWQKENPTLEKKGVQFVTIEPAKKGSKNFFKESIPPYFFNNDEEVEEPQKPTEKKKNKWVGPIEREQIEKSKSFVNLNETDN